MGCADDEGLAAMGLEAARLAGCRVILVSEWPGFTQVPRKAPRLQQKKRICGVVTGTGTKDGVGAELPSNVLVVDRNVPIQYLLSQCSVAAHSGCTLWTGAVLKGGIPQIPCPFVGEQRFWSQHMLDMGVASTTLPVEKLTPETLADAIKSTMGNSDLNKRAKELQKILNDENGVHTTVDLISRFMQRPWDRTAMQILPRREGDLEMQEGTMFKSWNRYKFVLKDHCLEFHRYLPTGLHDPVVMGSYVIADADVSEFKDSSGYQQVRNLLLTSLPQQLGILHEVNNCLSFAARLGN